MIKKLVRHGNSKAIVIEKPVLDLLKIADNTPLEVITNGSALIILPLRDETKARRQMSFDSALAWVNENYKESLSRLAK
jgi:antitoxin component of MazEF toxin-antitoxin module